jgi:hypothetical protein
LVIGRWAERGFIPGATGQPFTGFPPIRETELRTATVDTVD